MREVDAAAPRSGWLNTKQVADFLGVKPKWVTTLIRQGRLRAARRDDVHQQWYVPVAEVEAYAGERDEFLSVYRPHQYRLRRELEAQAHDLEEQARALEAITRERVIQALREDGPD